MFGEATEEQARIMRTVLDGFCAQAGQKVNLAKSAFYVSENTNIEVRDRIQSWLNIQPTSDLGNYLGMPLLHKRMTTHMYSFIVDKVRKKLSAWKARMLSQTARSLLIQSVLSALPAYAMQTVKLPQSIIDNIERHMRRFYWDEWDGDRKLHYISWETLCKPKSYGGLGFRNLKAMNAALLAKLGWQMLKRPERLWARLMKAKYGSILEDSNKQGVSATWRGLRTGVTLLRKGLTTSNFLHEDMVKWVGRGDIPKKFQCSGGLHDLCQL